jgi:hypothetical protein
MMEFSSRTLVRVLGVANLLVWASTGGFSQQLPCTVPVNVLVPDLTWPQSLDGVLSLPRFDRGVGAFKLDSWDLARDLPAQAFVAHDGKRRVHIQSVTNDSTPRRIVFIVENGFPMTAAARKIEEAVITDLLSQARPDDSFALLTARGPRRELRFRASREEIRAVAEELGNPPQVDVRGEGVLDAVLEASTWFQPPQAGDSIFLMAMHLEGKSNVSFRKARATLAAGPIRLFGFQFGSPELDYTGNPIGWVERSVQMFALSRESGGVAVLEDTEQGRQYQLTNGRLEELRNNAQQMYSAVTNYYALQLDSISPHLRVDLAPSAKSQVRMAIVLHPQHLPPCSNITAATPAQAETTK